MICLSENTFQQLLAGTLPDARIADTERHLDDCRACRELFSALARAQSAPANAAPEQADCLSPTGDGDGDGDAPDVPAALAAGTRVGRFIVRGPLGAGGMGVVHAADDPVLGRKVALKLIHAAHCEGPASEEWRARLLREARAIARLSHPNVITVHDIGAHGDQLFVAMELVEGDTLRTWLAASPRSWREVVAVFVAAGCGLLAAHQVGLVHRDFKADNVLLGIDGQIRVTDFGLVYSLAGADRDDHGHTEPGSSDDAFAALGTGLQDPEGRLTRSGALVGTPGYIAPEVLRGGTADFASDQFSFCVALHEALVRIDGVPGWLQRTVERGLRQRPEDRYPDMDRLLSAMSREPTRRRWTLVGLAIVATVAVGVGVGRVVAREPEREICTGAREQISGVWNPDVSAQLQSSFAATARPHARWSADQVADRLDAYTGQWATMHRATCLATARNEQSFDVLDRRLLCLGRRLDQVGTLLDLLVRQPDGNLVDRAIDLVGDLEPLSTCTDPATLLSRVAPPVDPAQRARMIELERQIDRAELERQAGRLQAAADAARAVVDAQPALVDLSLGAQAGRVLGRSLDDLGRAAEAREALAHAQRLAERAGDIKLAVSIMLDLLAVVGVRQEHYAEAALLGQLVEGALERSELRGDQAMRARLLATLGAIASQERKVARAAELHREVLAIRRRIFPPISEEVANAEESLGIAMRDDAKQDEARTHYLEALAIRRRLFGDQHPLTATVHINLGVSYLDDANLGEARKHLLAAKAILERIPEYRHYHTLLNNLGELERMAGNYAEARRHHEAALAVRLRLLGPDHLYVGLSMCSIGTVTREAGDVRQALAVHRRALAVLEKSAGLDHPRYAHCLASTGEDLRQLGRAAESLSYQQRALEVIRARSPAWVDQTLLYQGLALLDLGRRREAIASLTPAYDGSSPGGYLRAWAAIGLARALDPQRPSSPRARTLAQEALTIFTALHIAAERDRAAAYLARAPRNAGPG